MKMTDQDVAIKSLEEALKIIQQAIGKLRTTQCKTCGGTKLVPTPQSIGFGKENAIMQSCPNCTSQEQPAELPWQQKLLEAYDRKRFLEMIERHNSKLSGVWDNDFTINGSELLTLISLGWGAIFRLDAETVRANNAEAEIHKLRPFADCYKRICETLGIEKDVLGYIKQFEAKPTLEQLPAGEFTKKLINTWNDYLSTSFAVPKKRELCDKVNGLIGKLCARLNTETQRRIRAEEKYENDL